jgi:hypothetical protein
VTIIPSAKEDISALFFDQKGLLTGIGRQGSKISKINPDYGRALCKMCIYQSLQAKRNKGSQVSHSAAFGPLKIALMNYLRFMAESIRLP